MSKSLSVQYCRIVAPEKLADRFLTSGALHQKESFELDQVVIFYVLEITKPWFPSSTVIPSILDGITSGHPTLTPSPNLANQFEELLRNINYSLNQLSEAGETDWIGNLNGLIVAIAGNELHFSQTGFCPAYLLQNNKIRQITDDTTEIKEPHPLKTFSNLASGKIKPSDHLLISNSELYSEISLDALRRIISSGSPATACRAITKELKREKNPAVSSIIIHPISAAEHELHLDEPTTLLLADELQSPLKKVQKKLIPIAGWLKDSGAKAGSGGIELAKKASKGGKELSRATLKQIEEIRAESSRQKSDRPVVEIIQPNLKEPVFKIIEVNDEPEKTEKIVTKIPKIQLSSAKDFYSGMALLREKESSQAIRELILNNRKLLILAIAILLLGISIISINARRSSMTESLTSNASTQTTLSSIEEKYQKIKTARELEQNIEASNLASEALAALNTLPMEISEEEKTKATTLWNNISKETDAITTTQRLKKSTTRYSFSTSSEHLISALPFFYGYATDSKELLRSGKGAPATVQGAVSLPTDAGAIADIATSNESDTAAYLLTENKKLFRVVQDAESTLLRPVSPAEGEFAAGDYIQTYNGSIYILDSKSGILWRYRNTGTVYEKGTSIIDSTKYDIKNSTSLAIDGSIYLLTSTGELQKFTSGEKESGFSLKKTPKLYSDAINSTKVITREDMKSIFILDAGLSSSMYSTARIMEYSKSGAYIRSFAFPADYTQIDSFDIDPKQNKIWTLQGEVISEFTF